MNELAPWQQRVFETALAALADRRLGHALLLSGPERLGKRAVAEALARRLLCSGAEGAQPACGHCRGCGLATAGSHPDRLEIGLEVNERTGKPRKEIVVEQIRHLGEWLALTPQLGGPQVALLDPAEGMNASAANALLKALEEPLPGRYLLLLSASPERLPATIRSRCQRLPLRLPAEAEALAWLHAQGHPAGAARAALAAADGHPGLAAHWLESGALAVREEVIGDLARLARGEGAAVAVAEGWLADAAAIDLRLRFAADHARERARDSGLAGLTAPGEREKLWRWYVQVNRLRRLLATPIRVDLALTGLLHAWRIADQRPVRRSGNRP